MDNTYYAWQDDEVDEEDFNNLERDLYGIDAERTEPFRLGVDKGKELWYFTKEIQHRARKQEDEDNQDDNATSNNK